MKSHRNYQYSVKVKFMLTEFMQEKISCAYNCSCSDIAVTYFSCTEIMYFYVLFMAYLSQTNPALD